ncbi:uncharacterized protein LOC129742422 [Uranotaenia lowii]|uniref:uncharacterized protein LOC129742422 n=1 Tax=Uranotaenia lowii TaxID=190385 RepID=UPI00247A6C05|nr:uncharacterized protein LOC129742422 [Uranotaenia lowii]
MYRMVKVQAEDQRLQRILWRDSPEIPVRTYELVTVTYGTACAPYLATKCLQQLADSGKESYPEAARNLQYDTYVDDSLTGANSVDSAIKLATEMIELAAAGGFLLRKFNSNSADVLSALPDHLIDERASLNLDSTTAAVKTLGLVWKPTTDCFVYDCPVWSDKAKITKRVVLAETARLFDTIGLVGPIVVIAKIFLQDLWKLQCGWDDSLPEEMQNFWQEYRMNLKALSSLSVPRWLTFHSEAAFVEIHGFCDASEKAYGACVYFRCTAENGEVTVRLITAKSRVASLDDLKRKKKKQTIPRLELSSALLLAHLIPLKAASGTTLQEWKIQRTCISRGMIPAQLQYQTMWFEGPLWLRQDRSTWPASSNPEQVEQSLLKERKVCSFPVTPVTSEIFGWRERFLDLIHLVAWMLRFAHNSSLRNPHQRSSGSLTYAEQYAAILHVVRVAQQESFPAEFDALQRGRPLKASSPILSLNPVFVDSIIRVGGRLAHAPISEDRKHPMILCSKHPLSKMIIEHYHPCFFHAGAQLLVSSVRGRFWITRIRSLVNTVLNECVQSFRNKPRVTEQLMGDLPAERVSPSNPFENVGVDYCGPFLVKYPSSRRIQPCKMFVAIFVCLATKAVHIELVTDLTSDSFIAAFKRFVGRRGKPRVVMCDNSTTFVGARRELDELRLLFRNEQFQRHVVHSAVDDETEFKFIRPGGLRSREVFVMSNRSGEPHPVIWSTSHQAIQSTSFSVLLSSRRPVTTSSVQPPSVLQAICVSVSCRLYIVGRYRPDSVSLVVKIVQSP